MNIITRMLPLAALAATLGGCAYDDYEYGGVSAGYGTPAYGYDQGYGTYASGYGGYGSGLGGWYDDFYYPGTGVYVIDRGGGRHRWNDRQRDYWQNRAHQGGGRQDGGRPGGWQGGRGGDRDQGRPGGWQGGRGGDRPLVNPYRGDGQYRGDQRRGGQGMPMRPTGQGRGAGQPATTAPPAFSRPSGVHPTPGPGPGRQGGYRGGAGRGGDGGHRGGARPAPQQ